MRHGEQQSEDLLGQDSFLDIIANIVGILILLVMVVGLRAGRQEPTLVTETRTDHARLLSGELRLAAQSEQHVTETDVKEMIRRVSAMQSEYVSDLQVAVETREQVNLRDAERLELANFLAQLEQEIETRRQRMSKQERRDYDLRAKLGIAQHELEDLTRQRIAAAAIEVEDEVETIVNTPTPIVESSGEDPIHVYLSGGHVTILPARELMEEAWRKINPDSSRVRNKENFELTAGPIQGFRTRMLIAKARSDQPGGGFRLVMLKSIFFPVRSRLGEPIDIAITSSSQLIDRVRAASNKSRPPILLWVYPDSYRAAEELKKTLHDLDYVIDTRPLPEGAPVGISYRGTRLAAQ